MRARAIALIAVLALAAVSCAQSSDDQVTASASPGALSLSVGAIPKSVGGDVVTLPVTVKGLQIVKPDGDTSGKTGHFHVFVDKTPVAAGKTIEKKRGIVHSAENPVKVFGLKPGKHTFHVVLGNGAHQRLGQVEDSVSVDVKGPTVQGTAPATISKGDDLTIELAYWPASGGSDHMSDHMTGHFHVLVDPMTPPKAGDTMPDAKKGSVYHTRESSLTIPGLKTGEHVIWIVHGNDEHVADDPAVMDKLTVTVS